MEQADRSRLHTSCRVSITVHLFMGVGVTFNNDMERSGDNVGAGSAHKGARAFSGGFRRFSMEDESFATRARASAREKKLSRTHRSWVGDARFLKFEP